MKKLLIFLPFFLLAEVNPFGAGIQSAENGEPYGLTPQERAILNNKKAIETLKRELQSVQKKLQLEVVKYDEQLNNLNVKVAAFQTLVDEVNSLKTEIASLRKDVTKNKQDIAVINEKIKKLEERILQLEGNVASIEQNILNMAKQQNENYMALKEAINTIIRQLKNQKPPTPKEAFKKAKELFKEGKYEKAKEYFLYTLSKNYAPASSAFYLGEIAYKRGDYNSALAYYKKSVEIYPKKAYFTPILLYHTALSFEKIGNKRLAKLTFEKLIRDFPNSKYAKLAKDELSKLQ
ncbi:MAG: tetratricopeptide repeat protein [Nautiliaceae bacterium]